MSNAACIADEWPPATEELVARDSYWEQRANVTNAYAKRKGAPGKITAEGLRARWSGLCYWCHRKIALGTSRRGFPLATVDHVVSMGRGGPNVDENIVWACRECNYSRNEEDQRVAS